jgi:NitT/TauT family transport system substrate-binding protein
MLLNCVFVYELSERLSMKFALVMRSFLGIALALAAFGSASPVRAQALIPLEVGTMAGDGSAEVFYAADQGFFKAEGLDVHITLFTNASAQASAVFAGTIAFGNGGVGSIGLARQKGILEKIAAPASVYDAQALTAALMVAKDAPYKTAADLDGKTIGTNGLQDQAQLESMLWLEKHGADLKTIKFVEIPFPEMAVALEAHRIDAALMVEPLMTAGATRVRLLGDAMGSIAPHFITTAWFASDSWLQANPDTAARFVRAVAKTAAWANVHHAETEQSLIRSLKLDPAIAHSMTRSVYGLVLDPALMQPVLNTFLHFGVLTKPVAAEDIVWKESPMYKGPR